MTTQETKIISDRNREFIRQGREEGAIWTLGGVIIALVILAVAII